MTNDGLFDVHDNHISNWMQREQQRRRRPSFDKAAATNTHFPYSNNISNKEKPSKEKKWWKNHAFYFLRPDFPIASVEITSFLSFHGKIPTFYPAWIWWLFALVWVAKDLPKIFYYCCCLLAPFAFKLLDHLFTFECSSNNGLTYFGILER